VAKARDAAANRKRSGASSTTAALRELLDLVVAYARQETLGPLRGLLRFVLFGVVGALALAAGGVFLLLALLRLLQDETGGVFAGTRSWLPYVVVTVAGLAAAGLAAWRITRTPELDRTGSDTGAARSAPRRGRRRGHG
jgi:hypothetical protein